MRAARAAALSALLASLLAGGGCFKPKILSGTLQCSPDDRCPDNFVCDTRQPKHLCVSSLDAGAAGATGGATGGTVGSGGKGGGMAGAGGQGGKIATGGTGGACLPPVANCATKFDGGACDPVCNVGCASCGEKCSVNSAGTLTCNPLKPEGTSGAGVFAFCHPSLPATDHTMDTDDCAPGSACVNHNTCGTRCYRFCRTMTDCPAGSTCSIDAGAGQSFCDSPAVDCDPVNGVQNTPQAGCPIGVLSCYLSGESGTTTCDCYNNGTGYSVGLPCNHSRDCYAGLVCTSLTSTSAKTCRRVCRLPASNGADLTNKDAGEQECATTCVPLLLPNGNHTNVFGACNDL